MSQDRATQADLTKQSIAYALIGFGAPSLFAGMMLFRIVFLPGHSGPSLAKISFSHPAFVVSAILMGFGSTLFFGGLSILKSVKRAIGRHRNDRG
ncbi:hypothetical protein [Phenylobacterium montanum]|uniref:Uncharacterized protein n=1 Tax=Phenylobacterium montanum TaxID=2823693 RepID=A0A975ITQ0_9CAUL|nr:hypothetical protein [Caulobacter sp. S6]QUD86699.1 hypothetical protein KCG34_16660 [Caulobacter sp. S6]